MMLLVINEWLFHDLLLENGEENFHTTARFLIALGNSPDRLLLPTEKRWNEKAYQLMTMSDPRRREVSQKLHRLLRDSDRAVRVLDQQRPSISETLDGRVPRKDIYLVAGYIGGGADILVTTDNELFEILGECDAVNCQMRDTFLEKYLG
jgi:hypothetical protein